MYSLEWYAQNAGLVLLVLETLKQSGGHWLRDKYPAALPYYPAIVKAIGLLVAMAIAVGAKADLLLSIDVEGVHPYVGYIAAGIGIFGGNTILDMAWDNKALIKAVLQSYQKAPPNA